MLKVRVLGSAAGGGYPQWNCNCPVCQLAWRGDARVRRRTQSSIAVSADGEQWFLFNASPDLREQIAANPPLQPAVEGRHSPIAGVVLTNADVDHIGGLLTVRESQPLNLYATAKVLDALAANSLFNVLNPDFVSRRPLSLDRPVELATPVGDVPQLEIEAFAVPGKVALFLEGLDENTGEDTVALHVRARDSDAHFYYIPGCARVTPELADRLADAPLVLFDGTLWTDDEMIQAGVGRKTGQRMGHISLSGPDGTLAVFRDMPVRRKILIHINNTNPILIEDSPEAEAVAEAGWEIAYDGMEISL